MKKVIGAIMVSLLLALAIPSFSQAPVVPFTDVPAGHWAAQALADLADAGVIEGLPGVSRYDGDRPMTRYEAAVALARLLSAVEQLPGMPASATLEQIRNLILTDPDVQARLRGPVGATGVAGTPGAPGAPGVGNGQTGPVGQPGKEGPPGPAGPAGSTGAGFTPQQVADLNRLLQEFGPEIAAIRNDVATLRTQMNDVEARIPPLRVSINGGYRFGLYGTGINLPANSGTSADHATIYGAVLTPAPGTDPDNTLAKDALKGSRFGVYLVDVNIDGAITEAVAAHATLRAITPVDVSCNPFGLGLPYNATPDSFDGQNSYFGGTTWADSVQLWDWYAKVTTSMLGNDITATAGRFSRTINQGLLIDTSAQPLTGLALDSGRGNVRFGVNGSTIDRGVSAEDPRGPQDLFGSAYLGLGQGDWNITGSYLASGVGGQTGWGLGMNGKILGRRIFGEFAQLLDDYNGNSLDDDNNGYVIGINLLENTKGLSLSAKYGDIEPNFRPALSQLRPYSAVNAYDIDWIDRPLYLSPDNVTKGFEGNISYVLGSWTAQGRVYFGDKVTNAINTDADMAWSAKLKKQITKGVAASVLYGEREVDKIISGAKLKTLRTAIEFTL